MIPKDFILEIGKRQVPNHVGLHKFGVNPSIGTAEGVVDIWDGGGRYPWSTSGSTYDFTSDDVADTGSLVDSYTCTQTLQTHVQDDNATFITDGVAAGDIVINDTQTEHAIVSEVISETILKIVTVRCIRLGQSPVCVGFIVGDSLRIIHNAGLGASVVFVQGLNENFSEISEYVMLQGATPVTTLRSYFRMFRVEVVHVAPHVDGNVLNSNLGTISGVSGATTRVQIQPETNHSLMAQFTVPRGSTGFITTWWLGLANKQAASSTGRIAWGDAGGPLREHEPIIVNSNAQAHQIRFFEVPEIVPEMNDITVRGDTDTNGVALTAGFDLILVSNKVIKEGLAVK